MSRILLVAFTGAPDMDAVRRAARSMAPDNIRASETVSLENHNIAVGIYNPDPVGPRSANGVVVGHFFDESSGWDQVGAETPNGSFALCRWSSEKLEIVTDAAGSRTLWYVRSESFFAVSSCISALVILLGDFLLDQEAIPWMIATGSLGERCWDERIRRAPPDSVVTFDRSTGEVLVRAGLVDFNEGAVDLAHELDLAFSDLSVAAGAVVALSGGVDSRAILAAMCRNSVVPAITWGSMEALSDTGGDVVVAQKVASHLKTPHQFLEITSETADIDDMIRRFIDVSEGRSDHLGGYTDGFSLWKQLHEAGVSRIVRGDEGFGWNVAIDETQTRRDLGLSLLRDYFSEEQMAQFGLMEVAWPGRYARGGAETLEGWRDRLYHSFRIPTVLASLNDIKSAYVEIVNPLLARRLIMAARRLPDRERTGKAAFRRWALKLGPTIPYARAGGNKPVSEVLRTKEYSDLVERELADADWITDPFRQHILGNLRRSLATKIRGKGLRNWLRKLLPAGVKARLRASRSHRRTSMDPVILALRAVIVTRSINKLGALNKPD